jgi:hypothetical protein
MTANGLRVQGGTLVPLSECQREGGGRGCSSYGAFFLNIGCVTECLYVVSMAM